MQAHWLGPHSISIGSVSEQTEALTCFPRSRAPFCRMQRRPRNLGKVHGGRTLPGCVPRLGGPAGTLCRKGAVSDDGLSSSAVWKSLS